MAKRLPITGHQGVRAYALVDDEDYDRLAQYSWHFTNSDYPHVARWDSDHRRVWLHHAVLGIRGGHLNPVDHIDLNPLNNRKDNLRPVTPAQNAQNQGSRGGTSKYRGVSWCKARRKWIAQATLDYKKYGLGRYDTEEEAAQAASDFRAQHMPFSEDARLAA